MTFKPKGVTLLFIIEKLVVSPCW